MRQLTVTIHKTVTTTLIAEVEVWADSDASAVAVAQEQADMDAVHWQIEDMSVEALVFETELV